MKNLVYQKVKRESVPQIKVSSLLRSKRTVGQELTHNGELAARVLQGPAALRSDDLLTLQRMVGNQAVGRWLQARLEVGASGDPLERQADQVAERVVQQVEREQSNVRRQVPEEEEEELQESPDVRRQDEEEEEEFMQMQRALRGVEEGVQAAELALRQDTEEEEEELQAKSVWRAELSDVAVGAEGGSVPSTVERAIRSTQGQGARLEGPLRGAMERAFGADLGGVRLHTDQHADALSRALTARAFTVGRDIYFRRGEYQPESRAGRLLLAHELTHVVQQGAVRTQVKRARPAGRIQAVRGPQDAVIRRWAFGTGAAPSADWQVVPAGHQARVRAAMNIITRKARTARLINYFRDHAPGGTANTLAQVLNRARVWELRNEGSLGMSFEGGSDMAYDPYMYRLGRWQIAATLLHEMGHLARFPTEEECEGAIDAGRTYAPYIESVQPRAARVGQVVIIRGITFGRSQGTRDRVLFNGVDAGAALSWSWQHNTQGQIRVRVPAGATSGPLVVVNNNVRSNQVSFRVIP